MALPAVARFYYCLDLFFLFVCFSICFVASCFCLFWLAKAQSMILVTGAFCLRDSWGFLKTFPQMQQACKMRWKWKSQIRRWKFFYSPPLLLRFTWPPTSTPPDPPSDIFTCFTWYSWLTFWLLHPIHLIHLIHLIRLTLPLELRLDQIGCCQQQSCELGKQRWEVGGWEVVSGNWEAEENSSF